MKKCSLLILIIWVSCEYVSAGLVEHSSEYYEEIPINLNNFTCSIDYESNYAEVKYVNETLLSKLGLGQHHFKAKYINTTKSYFQTCERAQKHVDKALTNGGKLMARIVVYWVNVNRITGCEGGSWGGCTHPIYEAVPTTKVVLSFDDGIQLASTGYVE